MKKNIRNSFVFLGIIMISLLGYEFTYAEKGIPLGDGTICKTQCLWDGRAAVRKAVLQDPVNSAKLFFDTDTETQLAIINAFNNGTDPASGDNTIYNYTLKDAQEYFAKALPPTGLDGVVDYNGSNIIITNGTFILSNKIGTINKNGIVSYDGQTKALREIEDVNGYTIKGQAPVVFIDPGFYGKYKTSSKYARSEYIKIHDGSLTVGTRVGNTKTYTNQQVKDAFANNPSVEEIASKAASLIMTTYNVAQALTIAKNAPYDPVAVVHIVTDLGGYALGPDNIIVKLKPGQTKRASDGLLEGTWSSDPGHVSYTEWARAWYCAGNGDVNGSLVDYGRGPVAQQCDTTTNTGTITPTVASFTASPTSVLPGRNSTLSWSSTNADSCTITNNTSTSKILVGSTGSMIVSPTSTTKYEIMCSKGSVKSVSRSITINVGTIVPTNIPTITSFTANPTAITAGQSSTLSWSSNATSCIINGNGLNKAANGSMTVSPTITTQYTIVCSKNLVLSNPKYITINVTPISGGSTTNPYASTLSSSVQNTINTWITKNITSRSTTLSSTDYSSFVETIIGRLNQIKSATPASNINKLNVINYLVWELQNILNNAFFDGLFN